MNDLDQLKELLFGAEKEALDSIAERVERPEVRTADVADVLPEAIHQSHKKNRELVDALSEPVGDCLRQEFSEDPQTYGDALYPVMGPAIRKSIMHALRTLAQQINEAVEHSVSPRGLRWRWQASRAGIPFGEYVLQKTMQYRVEQAYLISRENGLLMGHVHHEASKIKDSDAVSAMFTAIQDFVKESFSPDRTGRLESADMGEFTLWAVHGPHALLVCVIRGVPPKSLRADLSAILERIHFRYGEAIRDYKGETSTVPDVEIELERCLRFEARQERASSGGRPSIIMILLLLALAAGAIFLGVRSWLQSAELEELGRVLDATPGIHVTEATRDGPEFHVRGLRDPLAPTVSSVAEGIGIEADRVSAAMQPFQSLEAEIIEARAHQLFGGPETVRFEVSGRTLIVSGDAPVAWRRQVESRASGLAGIDRLDLTGLIASDLQEIMARFENLDARKFYFGGGTEFVAGQDLALRDYASEIKQLAEDARTVGRSLVVIVTGGTDALGGDEINAILGERRAAAAASVLAAEGIEARTRVLPAEVPKDGELRREAEKRFVQVDLELQVRVPGQ